MCGRPGSSVAATLRCSRRSLLTSTLATGAAYAPCLAATGHADTPPAESGPVSVDVSLLPAGQIQIVQWRGKPVWVLHRSAEMLATLESPSLLARLADPASRQGSADGTPRYASNPLRSIRPDMFVGLAVCPHAGCQPTPRLKAGPNPEREDNWPGGFTCQCHFATFDLAGRVFADRVTTKNIEVPRHMYGAGETLIIGRDQDGEA